MAMTQDQYREQLRSLLPPGDALNDGGAGFISMLLQGIAGEFARVDARGDALVLESLPNSTLELLPDWERVASLPDDCTPEGQTIDQRRQALVARFVGNGTPSIPYLTQLAATLGYQITIVKRQARRYRSKMGTTYGGTAWMFVWEVHAPLNTVVRRTSGSPYGEAYATWQNAVLECVIRQHAPAHTIVNFIYQ